MERVNSLQSVVAYNNTAKPYIKWQEWFTGAASSFL